MPLFLHPDVRIVLGIMKSKEWANDIHNISYKTFFEFFWTAHQLDWRNHVKLYTGSASMDATGYMIKKFDHCEKEKSNSIFLYIIAVGDEPGQYIVAMMNNEAHNTVQIAHFLQTWVHSGAPHPKEFTTDGAKASLTAVICSFTEYFTIDEYSAACGEGKLPKCFLQN